MNLHSLRITLVATLIAAGALSAGEAAAQASANTSTAGSAIIFQPISIAKTADLKFGIIVRPTTAGTTTVTLPAGGGTRTSTGQPVGFLGESGANAPQLASFTVQGEPSQTFTIGVPTSFTMAGPNSGSLTVAPAASAGTGNLGAGGSTTFAVGGTIQNLSSTTPSGSYTGSFVVTVTYQ